MDPKQRFIKFIFGPLINFFQTRLKISGFLVCFISIPIFKAKTKTDMDILRKVLIIFALIFGFV